MVLDDIKDLINKRKIFRKINRAVKNNTVLVLNDKYRQLYITTKLLELCIKTDSRLVVKSNRQKESLIDHILNNYSQYYTTSKVFRKTSVDLLPNYIMVIGSITNRPQELRGNHYKLILDNSIQYKDYKSIIHNSTILYSVESISGVVMEDMDNIEEYIK